MALLLLLAASFAQDVAPVAAFPFSVEGTIEAADPTDPGYGVPYDDYPLLLSGGTRYRFIATPSGATETLMLRLREPGDDMDFATDFAFSPDQRNAQLTFGPQSTGIYVLRVSSIAGRGSGPASAPYRLTVTPISADALPPAPAPAATRPAAWRIWQGALTPGDPDDVEGRNFHEYRLPLPADRDTIIMAERVSPGPAGTPAEGHAGLVLTVRAVGGPDDMFELLGTSEGSATGPAVAAVRPERTGDYIVRVMAPAADAAIAYRLMVTE